MGTYRTAGLYPQRTLIPVPDTLSEFAFAGLLRGSRTEVVDCAPNGLQVPTGAEIVLEPPSPRPVDRSLSRRS